MDSYGGLSPPEYLRSEVEIWNNFNVNDNKTHKVMFEVFFIKKMLHSFI